MPAYFISHCHRDIYYLSQNKGEKKTQVDKDKYTINLSKRIHLSMFFSWQTAARIILQNPLQKNKETKCWQIDFVEHI